tara:strand:+ start:328 stop:768 length:441 start_codon:yes stop_codon:yes gene_type:complete
MRNYQSANLIKMSFLASIKSASESAKLEVDKKSEIKKEEKEEKLKKRQEEVKDTKFHELSKKYHLQIKRGIENAAKEGKSEKYINFDRNDFKANCFGLGNPDEFLKLWLNEIVNPKSNYIPDGEDSFEGFTFQPIGNFKFTTKISW